MTAPLYGRRALDLAPDELQADLAAAEENMEACGRAETYALISLLQGREINGEVAYRSLRNAIIGHEDARRKASRCRYLLRESEAAV